MHYVPVMLFCKFLEWFGIVMPFIHFLLCLTLSVMDMVHDVGMINIELVRTEEHMNMCFFAEEVVTCSAD